MATTTEGTVPFRSYRTWYQVVGEPPATDAKPPLLAVHGGPGLPHDYLQDLAELADDGRAVVFYDQLGCHRAYVTRWICRRDPLPDHVLRSFTNLSGDVYATMQGPEWNVSGNLKDWDVTTRLGQLDPPVLVISGHPTR